MSRDRRRRPPFRRRDRIGISFVVAVWLVVVGAIGACIGLAIITAIAGPAHSAPANADQQAFEYWAHHGSRVCAELDREPTVEGVATAGLYVINHGHLTARQAGQVVHLAVEYTCPRHAPLVDQYLAQHTRNRETLA